MITAHAHNQNNALHAGKRRTCKRSKLAAATADGLKAQRADSHAWCTSSTREKAAAMHKENTERCVDSANPQANYCNALLSTTRAATPQVRSTTRCQTQHSRGWMGPPKLQTTLHNT